MSKKIIETLCLGKPRAIDTSTLVMGLYSTDKGRLGQILISVNVVAIYGGAVEAPPELMDKFKELLAPERNTSFKLGNAN